MPEVGGYQPRDDEERHRHCQQADDHPREEAVPNMLPVRGQGNGLAIRRRDPHHLEVGCAPDVGHQRRLLELHYPSVLSHPDPARSAASEPWRAAAEAISWAVSATERLPSAMCSMASTTSWVEERCCWVASCTWPLTSVIARIIVSPRSICLTPFSSAITVSLLCACAPSTSLAIWAAAALERSASRRTSSATTANPRPASPARAASIAALRASRLVWSAMSLMSSRMPSISLTRPASARVRSPDAFRSDCASSRLVCASAARTATRPMVSATRAELRATSAMLAE